MTESRVVFKLSSEIANYRTYQSWSSDKMTATIHAAAKLQPGTYRLTLEYYDVDRMISTAYLTVGEDNTQTIGILSDAVDFQNKALLYFRCL